MDLNAPLGMTPPPPRRRRQIVVLVGAVAAVAALGGVALILVRADPHGGRPSVVAAIPPALPRAPSHPAALDPTPTGTVPTAAPVAPPPGITGAGRLEGGVMVFRGSGTDAANGAAAPTPLVIDVTRVLDDPLGKGRRTAPPVAAGAAKAPAGPRVAIFVSGMGLDAGATRTATENMPAAVTLAFLPYGDRVGAGVAEAKAKGHEVLLQLPMRNDGGVSPGPHALRADAPPDALKGDLAWAMNRFSGYDGVANLLGAPVTADEGAMSLILRQVGAKHLFFLDDGTSHRSVAARLAAELNVEAVKADVVLDATADPAVVRANLDKLVALAKRNGKAVGMASGLPEHLGTIARFAADLRDRGVTLVPVGTFAHDAGAVTVGAAATR